MSESEINVSKWKNKINFVINLKAASTTVNKEKKNRKPYIDLNRSNFNSAHTAAKTK